MTSDDSTDIKEVLRINDSAIKAFDQMPTEVQEAVDRDISRIQNELALPRDRVKGLAGRLAGVSEIRINHDSDTYRVYYVASFKEVVFVLDAGIKKSHRGGDIPRETADRLVARLRLAKERYEQHKPLFEKRYEQRAAQPIDNTAKSGVRNEQRNRRRREQSPEDRQWRLPEGSRIRRSR